MSYANLLLYNLVIPSYDDIETAKENNAADKSRSKKTQGLNFGEFISVMKGLQ